MVVLDSKRTEEILIPLIMDKDASIWRSNDGIDVSLIEGYIKLDTWVAVSVNCDERYSIAQNTAKGPESISLINYNNVTKHLGNITKSEPHVVLVRKEIVSVDDDMTHNIKQYRQTSAEAYRCIRVSQSVLQNSGIEERALLFPKYDVSIKLNSNATSHVSVEDRGMELLNVPTFSYVVRQHNPLRKFVYVKTDSGDRIKAPVIKDNTRDEGIYLEEYISGRCIKRRQVFDDVTYERIDSGIPESHPTVVGREPKDYAEELRALKSKIKVNDSNEQKLVHAARLSQQKTLVRDAQIASMRGPSDVSMVKDGVAIVGSALGIYLTFRAINSFVDSHL